MGCTLIEYDKDTSLSKALNNIYEEHSIYRSIIVCDNEETVNTVYENLKKELSVFKLSNEKDLENFKDSQNRVMIIHFMQMYRYPKLFLKHSFEDGYLWLLNDLNDLQESCCINQVKSINKKLFVCII